jgi:hypothetical protein
MNDAVEFLVTTPGGKRYQLILGIDSIDDERVWDWIRTTVDLALIGEGIVTDDD